VALIEERVLGVLNHQGGTEAKRGNFSYSI
jgi:hypothetical protein